MSSSLLDPIVIAQLESLQLRAERILDGLYSGYHTNPYPGSSQIFSQHRAYNPGDDLKRLDWKVFGRTDRFVVKQFEEESNVAAMVLVDDSASMSFSHAGRPSKLEYAKTMAATIAYLLVSQHDGVGFLSGHDHLHPGNDRGHLEHYFQKLSAVKAGGVWDLPSRLKTVESPLKRRSFVIVFSDLMEDADAVASTLRTLHAQRHEVIVFHLLDPAEIDLPFEGPMVFKDLESGAELKTEPDVIRESYRRVVQKKLAEFSHRFRGGGLDYVLLPTDTPFIKGMGMYLSWRALR